MATRSTASAPPARRGGGALFIGKPRRTASGGAQSSLKIEPKEEDDPELAWARRDYLAIQVHLQQEAYAEAQAQAKARRAEEEARRAEEGARQAQERALVRRRGVIVLDDSSDDDAPPAKQVRLGDPGQSTSSAVPKDEPPSDGGDYDEAILRSLGML